MFSILISLVVVSLWLFLMSTVWVGHPVVPSETKGYEAYETGKIEYPRRFRSLAPRSDPPPLAEIERNLTLYLHSLHDAFEKLQGAKAVPVDIWEAYINITKSTVMAWDDENRNRFPLPRKDNSIFVSLGTYRGCMIFYTSNTFCWF